jgi:hypothetical protein
MTMTDRSQARKVQDKVIADKRTRQFVSEMGEDYPLFGEGTPTFKQIKQFVFPAHIDRMERFLSAID